MGSLSSKKIIITGGSLGIGLAIAKACAYEGAEVILVARDETNLNKSLNTIKKISNKNHLIYPLDVADLKSVNKFTEWINEKKIDVNGLVNCAGIYGPIGKICDISMDDFVKAININFLGTVFMCSALSKILVSSSNKKIVNFSGGGAATPFPNYSAYASSKIALVRFSENLSIFFYFFKH